MKLFLLWLLGVPLIVTSMVMAQSLAMENQQNSQDRQVSGQPCSLDGELHHMTPIIVKKRYGSSCDQLSIH